MHLYKVPKCIIYAKRVGYTILHTMYLNDIFKYYKCILFKYIIKHYLLYVIHVWHNMIYNLFN